MRTMRTLAILSLVCIATTAVQFEKPVVISGGGPGGLTFCHRLLSLNKEVKIIVYEKRERPQRYSEKSTELVAGDNAFGFGLSQKTQLVLKKTKDGLLEEMLSISQPVTLAPKLEVPIINRREMCAELLHQLEKDFGSSGRLEIVFDTTVTEVKENSNSIVVTNSAGETKEVPYSLLVAADGANSRVRSDLIDSGDISCERYLTQSTWKALQMPAQPNLDPCVFHRFKKVQDMSDSGAMIPRFENRFVLTHFGKVGTQFPFNARTPQELKEAISVAVPNVTEFPDDQLIQKFIDQPPGRESYMKLNRHVVTEKKIALIGDASVGMYSLLGQGCASAMLQADDLAEELNSCSTLEDALETYNTKSVREGHAITELNLMSHGFQRKGIIKFWFFLQFVACGKILSGKPEVPFSSIKRKFRFTLWVSRFFWRRDRIDVSPSKK